MARLDNEFYDLNALTAAPLLLGKFLCRKTENKTIKVRITETECYMGEEDTACHAHKGKTRRTEILYESGGVAYVYLCYGTHSLLNIVTGEKDIPQSVFIRAVEGYEGPGKLTKYLKINKELNGEDLKKSERLWIEDDGHSPTYNTYPRVGIDYATEEYRNKPWRFQLRDLKNSY